MQVQHIPETWLIQKVEDYTFIFDPDGKQRCGAKKRNGTPCMSAAMSNGRCRMHNGNAPVGEAAPAYKDGKHSRFRKQLPPRLLAIYDDYLHSAELDNLDPNIAILDLRIGELIERLEKGDYGATYDKLKQAFYRADLALRTKDMEAFAQHWIAVRELIETGSKDYGLWSQIVNLNDRRGKMVERKHNILNKSDMTITINQFVQTLRALEESFEKAAELPTIIQRRKHFSQAIQQVLAPMIIPDDTE